MPAPDPAAALRVGVSAPLGSRDDIVHDRAWQFTAFLLQALHGVPAVSRLWLLHAQPPQALPGGLDAADLPATPAGIEQLTHELDWVIDVDAALPASWLRRVRRVGARVVALRRGHPYADVLEPALFGLASRRSWRDAPVDEAWLAQPAARSCEPLLRVVERAPVWRMPRLWSPLFAQRRARALLQAGHVAGFRAPRSGSERPWNLLVAEPNESVTANAFLPMLACEAAYRECPRALERMMVLDTFHMKEHPTFNRFASSLDITRDARASFEPRLAALDAAAQYAMDCVVSQQWDDELRDDWCELLWAGYALVHNSAALAAQGVGLYYHGFRAREAAATLLAAWRAPREFWDAYRERSQSWLLTLDPRAQSVREAFAQRLRGSHA